MIGKRQQKPSFKIATTTPQQYRVPAANANPKWQQNHQAIANKSQVNIKLICRGWRSRVKQTKIQCTWQCWNFSTSHHNPLGFHRVLPCTVLESSVQVETMAIPLDFVAFLRLKLQSTRWPRSGDRVWIRNALVVLIFIYKVYGYAIANQRSVVN